MNSHAEATLVRTGSCRSGDAEHALAERVLVDDANAANVCRCRTVLAPRHERVDRFRRALEDRFDPAVGQVAHQPAQTGSLGPPGAGHAVAHALHPPLDDDPSADHPEQDTRRDVFSPRGGGSSVG